jgi:hypothetical protein
LGGIVLDVRATFDCRTLTDDQKSRLIAAAIQKVLKPLGLAITLKMRPVDPFAAVPLTETSGY